MQKRKLMMIAALAAVMFSLIGFASPAQAVQAEVSAVAECHDGTVWIVGQYTNNEAGPVNIQFTAAGSGELPQLASPGETVTSYSVTNLESVAAGDASWAVSGTGVVSDTKTAPYGALDCGEPEEPEEPTLVPLHNDTAEEGEDCPDTEYDYWHFVIPQNNGTYAFQSITLNLDGDLVVFEGTDIIPGGSAQNPQYDNVFVQVPDGYELGDLLVSGSGAVITPEGAARFNLSHICTSGGSGTTTTTTTTTTTVKETTVTTDDIGDTKSQRVTKVLDANLVRSNELPRTGSGLVTLAGIALLLLGSGVLVLSSRRVQSTR